MELAVAQNALRQHTHSILHHIQSLLEAELTDEQYGAVSVARQNTHECIQLLDQQYEMSPVDLSDYLNHHVRNLLTPIHGYTQFLELYDADALSRAQLYDLHAISVSVRSACDILKTLQSEVGSADYQTVEVA